MNPTGRDGLTGHRMVQCHLAQAGLMTGQSQGTALLDLRLPEWSVSLWQTRVAVLPHSLLEGECNSLLEGECTGSLRDSMLSEWSVNQWQTRVAVLPHSLLERSAAVS